MNHAWSEHRILTHLPAARELYRAQKDPSVPFPAPRFLSVWLSEVCNLDCTYCYFSETNHDPERKFIDADQLIKWLAEVRAAGAEALEFSGGGEPTVHKEFQRVFMAAKKLGYELGIITHACNPMPLDLMASNFKYVRCGLDAATPETHMKIKRKDNPKLFERALINIRELVRLRDKRPSGFTVGIKVVLNSINYREHRAVVSLAREIRVDYIQIKYEHSSDHPLTKEEIHEAQLYYDAEAKRDHPTKVLGNLSHQKATVSCFMSPVHTVVSAKGEILQCCFYGPDRPIGNISDPFREVWGSPKHREVMAQTTVAECDKVDCRWNYYNRRMKEVIEDPLAQSSFI